MKIALVGFGPRGLACLENLVLALGKEKRNIPILITVFEPSSRLGTGKAWELNQPETNYINISDHALQNLQGREKLVWGACTIPSFPSYSQWCINEQKTENIKGDKDVYPARSQMGTYLNQRASSICTVLKEHKLLTICQAKITDITFSANELILMAQQEEYKVTEAVLTLGHLPTKDSEETKQFKAHARNNACIYIDNPYETLLAQGNMSNTIVAIKGFGLSMIDIARQFTSYAYGRFKKNEKEPFLNFIPEKGCVHKLIPYSFDGLPCVPKPYGRTVDEQFAPTNTETNTFELAVRNSLSTPEANEDLQFLLDAFARVAAAVFKRNHKEIIATHSLQLLIVAWLQDTNTKHELILDTQLDTKAYMVRCVHMAYGTEESSLDYTIGQVWRHLQPTMYRLFAFSGLPGHVLKKLVTMDESIKRYSYGPPVESILQLIALVDANILDLRFVNNPEVTMIETGWKLSKDKYTQEAQQLCNSVMEAPVLKELESPLIDSLEKQQLIQAVHPELGIQTYPDATVVPVENQTKPIPISVIGRNAKGSVLGTDAILECFSPEISDWAAGVVHRFKNYKSNTTCS